MIEQSIVKILRGSATLSVQTILLAVHDVSQVHKGLKIEIYLPRSTPSLLCKPPGALPLLALDLH